MRWAVAALLAVTLSIGAAAPAARAQSGQDRELAVTNHARHAINEFYASPTDANSWGDDRLGEDTLAVGRTARLKLHARGCEFDLQAVYDDASREEQHGVDVCRQRAVTFDGSGATASAVLLRQHEITLLNWAARPIQQVLVSPSDAGDWGDDRLGNASLSVGDAATIRYRGDCVADIRVVFDNRSAEERRGVDVCATRHVAIQPGWDTDDTVPSGAVSGQLTELLTVVNRTGRAATGLYLYPDASPEHGPDLLAGSKLAPDARLDVSIRRPADQCSFTAQVVFPGPEAPWARSGLDLCHATELALTR